jgi:hypothetical protein
VQCILPDRFTHGRHEVEGYLHDARLHFAVLLSIVRLPQNARRSIMPQPGQRPDGSHPRLR